MPNEPGIRPEVAVDPDMADLVEYFVGELPNRVRSLEDAAKANHLEEIRTLAHQLKGAAPGFGFPSIGEAARVVEHAIKSAGPDPQQSLDFIRADLESLISLCRSYMRPS